MAPIVVWFRVDAANTSLPLARFTPSLSGISKSIFITTLSAIQYYLFGQTTTTGSHGPTIGMALLGALAIYVAFKLVKLVLKVAFILVGVGFFLGAFWWLFTPH